LSSCPLPHYAKIKKTHNSEFGAIYELSNQAKKNFLVPVNRNLNLKDVHSAPTFLKIKNRKSLSGS